MWFTSLKQVLDSEVDKTRFVMSGLYKRTVEVLQDTEVMRDFLDTAATLGEKKSKYLFQSTLRAAFLIELVKEDVSSTKMAARWSSRFEQDDPRYASFDTSYKLFEHIMTILSKATSDPSNRELLRSMRSQHQVAYELPIDYLDRKISSPIHESENVGWIEDDLPERVLKLRVLLLNKETNSQAPFFAAAYKKIQVKSYLTDRALTGKYKTNREKRWETHPGSVQFALRRDCMEVEYNLINQLCHFEGFNPELVKRLEEAGLLNPIDVPSRCPVTMDPLSFTEFERGVFDPQHGTAEFHVGHLNPLKATNDDPTSGHTAQNVSWISSDGNRIQGSLSLQEVRNLLNRIQENYQETQTD